MCVCVCVSLSLSLSLSLSIYIYMSSFENNIQLLMMEFGGREVTL